MDERQQVWVVTMTDEDGYPHHALWATELKARAFAELAKAEWDVEVIDLPVLTDEDPAQVYAEFMQRDFTDEQALAYAADRHEMLDGFAAQVANSTTGPLPEEPDQPDRDWEGEYAATSEQMQQAMVEAAERAAWDPNP